MTITVTGIASLGAVQVDARDRRPFLIKVGRAELVGRWIIRNTPTMRAFAELNERTPQRTLQMLARAINRGDTFLITLDGFPIAWFMKFWLITQYELPTITAEAVRTELRAALRP